MSDNEIEDVSFLQGTTPTNKRAVYEPKGAQRCKQLVCSQGRALLIVAVAVIFILIVALIASFARPIFQSCSQEKPTALPAVVEPTEAIATNGEKFPWTDIRLPRTVLPESYRLRMHPNLTTLIFNGSVSITVRVVQPTDFIVLHVKNLNVNSHKVIMETSMENIPIVKILEYKNHQQLYLQLDRTLTANTQYTVSMNFGAPLSNKLMGFYNSSYTTSSGQKRYLATTQFEPTDARAAFPCFDEPNMKATFQLSMIRDLHHLALFNMPREREDPYTDGIVVDHFQASVKMSTYLVAFVVCDYKKLQVKTNRNITVSVYAPEEQISQTKFALSAAKKVLDYYEDFFGVPYPLPKQDLIAIPDFSAGAMENWGLVTYRMTAILYDANISSAYNAQWVAVVIAHELAHQWFGNLVTMKWWNDLWLNEGFASFVEFLGADQVDKTWKMRDQFVVESLHKALDLDALSNSHPISVTVDDPDQISEIFDAISYDKGASIIRMLQQFLGEKVLENCLKLYLSTYKFSNAETADLWNTCTEAGKTAGLDIDVKQVMDTWTLQMGYPVVMVTKGLNNKYTATQQRYLLNPKPASSSEFKSPYNYRWHIPLTYVTEKTPHWNGKIKMMNMESVAFDVLDGSKWIKANVEQKGFYRVNYEAQNWKALIVQLKINHTVFSAADRASLLDDAFALSRSGHITIETALGMSQYLLKEIEYVPWETAIGSLLYIGDLLADKPAFDSFKVYMKKLMAPLLSTVLADWQKVDSMSHLEKFLASTVLGYAVELNHESTVQKAKEMFNNWMNNGARVSPDLKKAVYRAGIMYGGDKEWMFCWQKYRESVVPSEKMTLLYAMTTTTNAMRLNRFLYYSVDKSKIRSQDTVSVITSIARNPAGRLLAWRFVQLNWDTFMKRYGSGSFEMSKLIMKTTDGFSTQMEYEEVKNFFTKGVQVGSGRRAVRQALESIQMNTDWLAKNEAKVTEWLSHM